MKFDHFGFVKLNLPTIDQQVVLPRGVFAQLASDLRGRAVL